MTNTDKLDLLESTISTYVSRGYIVSSKNTESFMCTVHRPEEKVNHILHFLITAISCGFWAIVWMILIMTSESSDTVLIKVNDNGTVTTS